MNTPRRSARARARRSQRGAALLTAMIIVALVVTLAASMVWQQWRAVQVEVAERSRAQSAWILSGALDWARLILREDARNDRPTWLGEPMFTQLAEARLSTFLAADKDNTDDAPEAFLSGRITDAQARYNLRNLVRDSSVQADEVTKLKQLCSTAGVDPEVATTLATALNAALVLAKANTNIDAPLLPQTLAQLSWLGVDAGAVQRLTPYVVLLPIQTPVNVNTASREVLAAAIKGLDLASAERLVQVRQRSAFKSLQDVEAQVPRVAPLDPLQFSVRSNFFEVQGRLRLSDRVLERISLVERRGVDVIVLQREVVASREQAGP
jgi:general secretion pathway protein K